MERVYTNMFGAVLFILIVILYVFMCLCLRLMFLPHSVHYWLVWLARLIVGRSNHLVLPIMSGITPLTYLMCILCATHAQRTL